MKKKETIWLIVAGLIIGVLAILLSNNGNPANMGFCIACFLRDTAGALHLHAAPVVQYVRPEIIGLVLGSFVLSLVTNEFKPRGGSSPILRFAIGFLVMIGALVFLGCPLRMVLRMAGGDLNAWIGLIGFIAGVYTGTIFLKEGFSLNRAHTLNPVEGVAFPLVQVALLGLVLFVPSLFAFSTEGPGSKHAALWMSLLVAIVVGMGAQKTRLCQAGGIRDVILFKDFTLLWGSIALFVAALVMNLVTGHFNLAMAGQPIAHTQSVWNILGLYVVGFGSTLIGGCPMRQLVLAGTGNSDSALTVLGMVMGAAFAHNFKLASSGEGTTPGGRIMTIVAIVVLYVIAFAHTKRSKAQ